MTTDMTSGSAYRHLWRYALPLMLGTLIQTSLRVVFTMLLAPRLGILGIAFACAGAGASCCWWRCRCTFCGCGAGKARREERRLPAGGKKTAKKGPAARNRPIKTGRFG